MKIEYLNKGSPECPLVRIVEFDERELQQLQLKCFELSQGRGDKSRFAGPPQRVTDDDYVILSRIADQDLGLVLTKAPGLFVLCLTNEGWRTVAEKLQPLLDEQQCFQWLSDQGEIKLLASSDGRW